MQTNIRFFHFKIIFLLCAVLLVGACSNDSLRLQIMILEGEEIIKKIEVFKKKCGHLPENLNELGITEKDGYNTIYYMKQDESNFTVSFPISAEEHLSYYSDSKKWEEGYRKM